MGVPIRPIILPFVENFADTINETSNPDNSESGAWNVTSGGYLNISKGAARTNSVDLQPGHRWFEAYKDNVDCEGGKRPENIFRMVSRDATLRDFTYSVSFKLTRISTTDSPNRTADKGVSLMFHYIDGNNALYASARHDGQLAIKRKTNGIYTTLALIPWFPGYFDAKAHPTLLPVGVTFSLKVAVKTLSGGTGITLYVSDPGTKNFHQAVAVSDNYPALAVPGKMGIRGDFCSFEIDDISIR